MSKSAGKDFILTLSESDKSLKNKVARIFTGGRDTKEEQQKLGGQPEICRVFDLFKFYFTDSDKELAKRLNRCKSGTILCGECKMVLRESVSCFIENHQSKKENKMDLAKQLLEG